MSHLPALPFDASRDAYDAQAEELLERLQALDEAAAWAFKWEHPRFRGAGLDTVRAAILTRDDARLVVARVHGFEDWGHLIHFADAVQADEDVVTFERAVEAEIHGERDRLASMLRDAPALARARSSRRHRATLLHYIAANGVEGYRQRTPPNAVEIARLLLDAGAEPDALADMYDQRCTTLSMLASSSPPAEAGLQVALVELLLDRGAALVGPGTQWRSALHTALVFGFPELAETLVRRGAPVDDLATAAGLGRLDDVQRLFPYADEQARHAALALAAQLGRTDVVRFLASAGVDVDRHNPEGLHAHATPLHQAVWSDHADTVRALVDAGARLDLRDTLYGATPLGWARFGERTSIADYLASIGAEE